VVLGTGTSVYPVEMKRSQRENLIMVDVIAWMDIEMSLGNMLVKVSTKLSNF
jgi:hypothetical protein